jgi:ACS family sodium-dependent inorganic phosphate cotransporter
MRDELGWTQTTKGWVLSAFFIGYLACMILSGWLAARFGGKRVLAIAVICWSGFTLLTPLAASFSVAVLIAARIGLGMGEAAVMPAAYDMFSRWVPPAERTRAVARLLSGIPVGQVVGFIATGWMTSRYGWPLSFYVFGAIGLVWAALWIARVHNSPADDRRVGAAERALLERQTADASTRSPTPWQKLLTKPSIIAIFIGHFCNNWGLYFLLAWLPSYFRDALGLSVANASISAAAPWLAAFVTGNASAALADRAIARGVRLSLVRKLTMGVGLLSFAVFMLLVRDVHSPATALTLVCLAAAAQGVCWSSFTPNLLEIAPRHASVLISVSNTFATIPGIAGVAITGWLVDTTGTFSAAFLLTAIVSVGGALLYFLLGDARRLDV